MIISARRRASSVRSLKGPIPLSTLHLKLAAIGPQVYQLLPERLHLFRLPAQASEFLDQLGFGFTPVGTHVGCPREPSSFSFLD